MCSSDLFSNKASSASGHGAVIDAMVDSAEYLETFGKHTVPYMRSWKSSAGAPQVTFNRTAAMSLGYAYSRTVSSRKPCSQALLEKLHTCHPSTCRAEISSLVMHSVLRICWPFLPSQWEGSSQRSLSRLSS